MDMNKPRAFSLLELIVTLAIMSLIIAVMLDLLNQTQYQINYINKDLAQRSMLQHSLDRLMDDLVMGSKKNIQIQIDKDTYNGLDTAWLKLHTASMAGNKGSGRQIDWVSVPRDVEDDLVLFRREQQLGNEEKALFIPQCENLYAFDVNMLDPNGDPSTDPNASTLIEVWAEMYQPGERDSDRTIAMKRTFSLHRFNR